MLRTDQHVRMFAHTVIPSDLGWLAIAWNGPRVCRVTIGHASPDAARQALEVDTDPQPCDQLTRDRHELAQRLLRWANGRTEDDFLDVALDCDHLTPFQLAVTERCRRIPVGQTITYGELAEEVGHLGAARAVGNVMRTNRWPLLVPCHRVLAAGGQLGGYSAPTGLNLKQRLLVMEGALA